MESRDIDFKDVAGNDLAKRAMQNAVAGGHGILLMGPDPAPTAELAERADKVVAVVIDQRLLPVLEETLADFDNVKIVPGGIRKIDVSALLRQEFGGLPVAVWAKRPYYITSPMLMLLLESRRPLTSITVMVQKEAAQRLCAQVGTREAGAITVGVHYYGEARQLFPVSRGSFMPAPNVDSAVIRIDLHENPHPEGLDEGFFFRMVKAGFSQRRKTLANSLASLLGIPKQAVYDALEQAGLAPAARIEQLSMEQLFALARILQSA